MNPMALLEVTKVWTFFCPAPSVLSIAFPTENGHPDPAAAFIDKRIKWIKGNKDTLSSGPVGGEGGQGLGEDH